ncbi:MAG: GNAT family N-acetyltransferase [Lacunisphaera sp.]|nr:GNAT family N-acetyltransferase [Lacunisphaera sp.]
MIRPTTTADAAAIAAIYNHYVLHTIVTFEEDAVTVADMTQRLAETIAAELPWLVWEESGAVLGYAHASK